MSIQRSSFGKLQDGTPVTLYTMKNKHGMEVGILDYGAIIRSIVVPDRDGKMADVELGFEDIAGYEGKNPCFGSFVGRVANRIGGAKFTIDGKTYELDKNNNGNCLHGGFKSYYKMMYTVECTESDEMDSVECTRLSPDMEQGFPGNLDITVTYSLTDNDEVIIEYFAVSDKDTLCNLTNHSYFNLGGHDSGTILDQVAWIDSEAITRTDDKLIPTGELMPIAGTPSDFSKPKPIGQDIHADFEPLKQGGGYDQNYCVKTIKDEVVKIAELYDPKSGRQMEVFSQLPGVQFYTANNLGEVEHGKNGAKYGPYCGCCFETQYYPNACNIDSFEGYTLKTGEEYDCATIYRFSVRK